MDPSRFEQVVLNLVVNARDVTPGGGKVRIETALDQFYRARKVESRVGSGLRVDVYLPATAPTHSEGQPPDPAATP
jgi:hypothetical protein